MRFTVNLDDDVYAMIKAEMRRTSRSFKQVVNEALRREPTMLPEKEKGPTTNESENHAR